MISPNEWQQELFARPAALAEDAKESIGGIEEFPQPDGKIIKLPIVHGKNGEKFYQVGGRKFRLAQRALQAAAEFQEAVTELFAPAPVRPMRPRHRNKLATSRAQIAEKRYINPFGKEQTRAFFIVPEWLVEHEEPSPLEVLIYCRLTFPITIGNGGFCEKFHVEKAGTVAVIIGLDLRLLAGKLKRGYSSTRKAFWSLVNRGLLEVENEKRRGALNPVRFLWHRWMQSENDRNEHSPPDENDRQDHQNSRNAHSSPHLKKQRNYKEHEHDHVHASWQTREMEPEEQDLLDQIEDLTARENRTEHFRATWIKRIREYPNQVFQAIGQTRVDQREGKIKKSIGGTLNWHFKNFREAANKRRSGTEVSGRRVKRTIDRKF